MDMPIVTCRSVDIEEFKSSPIRSVASADGRPLAVTSEGGAAFYCIPPKLFEALTELADDVEIFDLIKQRQLEASVAVELEKL